MAEQSNVPFDIIGEKQLSELVDVFYSRVSQHPDLAPIFRSRQRAQLPGLRVWNPQWKMCS